ncbi:MAG: hypothetical protein IH586_16130 [Anaerolineaceae bacterium]|nr:hypothetical protein [Anaerolineaceae bacterium]
MFQSTPTGGVVDYRLPFPKWQFLSYLCQTKALVLHGSQNPNIEVVEPRQADDKKAFSNQKAIYATTDGIWVLYFAIVNRKKFSQMTLFNSCIHIRISEEQSIGPLYFFSITRSALQQQPWCEGTVYILPRETFYQEPTQMMSGAEITFPHWISPKPVWPIAKLLIQPEDFPFLSQVHGHNDEKLAQLAAANPNGFPWPESLEI